MKFSKEQIELGKLITVDPSNFNLQTVIDYLLEIETEKKSVRKKILEFKYTFKIPDSEKYSFIKTVWRIDQNETKTKVFVGDYINENYSKRHVNLLYLGVDMEKKIYDLFYIDKITPPKIINGVYCECECEIKIISSSKSSVSLINQVITYYEQDFSFFQDKLIKNQTFLKMDTNTERFLKLKNLE
jgi:hypothetical protein